MKGTDMNRNTGAGIGTAVAMITGCIIGATTGQWWWLGIFLGVFSGWGWLLGKVAEERSSE